MRLFIIGVAVAATVGTLAWLGDRGQGGGTQAASQPSHAVDFNDLIPTCAKPPTSGTVLLFGLPLISENDAHRLTIENGSAGNAIVILRLAQTNQFAVELFVGKNDTAIIGGLPDGSYRVEWAIGGLLAADCRRFVQTEVASEFDAVMEMRTRYDGGYKYTANDRLTLYTVPGGNATSHAIDVKDFYAP